MNNIDSKLDMIECRIIEPCMEFIENAERVGQVGSGKDYYEIISEKRKKLREKVLGGGMIVPHFTLVVGTRCTLRCKNCINLMQYYDGPYDLDVQDLISDLEQFLSLIDYCMCISLVGGEPFIYPHLGIVLDYLKDNDKIASIEITTNGTVVPDNELLTKMSDSKIRVVISDYGRLETMSKLAIIFDQYKIKSECASNQVWINGGECGKRNRTDFELEQLYMACRSARLCKTLFKGKLFDCPRAAHLMDLGYANDLEFLDIYNCKKEDLVSFYIKNAAKACNYCDFSVLEKEYVEPAVQMNGKHLDRSNYTIILRENYDDLIKAKQYWEQQFNNSQSVISELKGWVSELESAKEYFLGQIADLERQNQELRPK